MVVSGHQAVGTPGRGQVGRHLSAVGLSNEGGRCVVLVGIEWHDAPRTDLQRRQRQACGLHDTQQIVISRQAHERCFYITRHGLHKACIDVSGGVVGEIAGSDDRIGFVLTGSLRKHGFQRCLSINADERRTRRYQVAI